MSHMDDGMLHTHLDGELDPAGEARLREHLATCADASVSRDTPPEPGSSVPRETP